MTEEMSDLMDTARLWMIRVNEPDFNDWDGLSDWLEADSRHLAAYEIALDEDAWVDGVVEEQGREIPIASMPRSSPGVPAHRRRWLGIGGAIAAAVAGIGTWTVMNTMPAGTEIVTQPGERRSIALSDGTRVAINGDSSINYDPDEPRFVTLERGEALFEVHHDAAKPFVVMIGRTRLIDAGTVFNVIREDGALEVAVAEGAVIYDASNGPVQLEPGDALIRRGPEAKIELVKADPASVGSWRNGVLQYTKAPLSEIARDLSRNVGQPVHIAPGSEETRFSGTLSVDGTAQEVMARAGPLLGVTFNKAQDGWEMSPTDDAPR